MLVLCPHGEQTVDADGRGAQPELGERIPLPPSSTARRASTPTAGETEAMTMWSRQQSLWRRFA